MGTYVLLMTLTPEGQTKALADSDYILDVERSIDSAGVQTLGVYAVLGPYDFVTLVEAPTNEDIAKFSIELGVKAGVHITTLPVIPASRLDEASRAMRQERSVDVPGSLPATSGEL